MAKEFTNKSRYKSSYTDADTWVTAGQYIAELICENIVSKKGGNLPKQFWNIDEWKNIFKRQLMLANGLLKIYAEGSIIKALRTPQGRKVISLAATFILDKIIDAFEKEAKSKKPTGKVTTVDKTEGIRPSVPTKKNSIWSLDNEE